MQHAVMRRRPGTATPDPGPPNSTPPAALQQAQTGYPGLSLLPARAVHTSTAKRMETTMTALGNAILWPGEKLCTLVGMDQETDSKHLLRLFFNLTIWSKVGAMIAIYWVDWGF